MSSLTIGDKKKKKDKDRKVDLFGDLKGSLMNKLRENRKKKDDAASKILKGDYK